ncbi:primosomal replication protein PriC [Colwellia sp. 1_MG-2023]|uniref:primosomal replication protein PriC n=1 Tax=Colwellia sp. 1_MG-2023 TaxID=3062649 RepID=UPI0026E34C06|nr:primosomal replication protein PriC [Colwellia sp. 1_MG-2023]MDO6445716.1 primosomal replication protein PriC [Colwellia sp. 1_MG-2023]
MKTSSLTKIQEILANLHAQAVNIDMANSKSKSFSLRKDSPIFSETLFSTNSDKLSHYVDEVINKSKELFALIKANKVQFSYARLALIEQQISAIKNAIDANDAQNNASKQHLKMLKDKKYRQAAQSLILPSQTLYQKLSETHEFERRLLDMLEQKQIQFSQANQKAKDKISDELLIIHQRLGRCRQAISKLERQIEVSEKR